MLEDNIFTEAMVTNPKKIVGGAITATAIEASFYTEKMKIADMMKNFMYFIRSILDLLGLKSDKIEFKLETIANNADIINQLNAIPELDVETKLIKLPVFENSEIQDILKRIESFALGNDTYPTDEQQADDSAQQAPENSPPSARAPRQISQTQG